MQSGGADPAAPRSSSQWEMSCREMKQNPRPFILIPVVAACVGYITNWVGVKMLFYPVRWVGIPIVRIPGQPFGWLGWQGIVVAKRFKMAHKMVDVTISQLLDVTEVFGRLDPVQLASLVEPTVRSTVLGGWSPSFLNRFFLGRACKIVIKHAERVVDIRHLVVSGLTEQASTLSNFFQAVAEKELSFLINSGFTVGFFLGILQMIQWMLFPAQWTLPVGGAIVGYITNWIALKWIFQPLEPTRIGPFVLQGMFLKRQKEVAEDFSKYIAERVLCSKRVWADVLDGTTTDIFTSILASKVPLPSSQINKAVSRLRDTVGNLAVSALHPLHAYCDVTLGVRATLEAKMKAMSSYEFEQVLHPIFQEDELTLILAGAGLGAAAGGLQIVFNKYMDRRRERRHERKLAETPLST